MRLKTKETFFSISYFLGLLILYPLILDEFNYMWRIDYRFNYLEFFTSSIIIVAITQFISFKGFGNTLISGLFYFLVVPALSVSVVTSYGLGHLYISLSTLISFFLIRIVRRKKILLRIVSLNKRTWKVLLLFLVLYCFYIIWSNINSYNIFNALVNVYELRKDLKWSGFVSYFLFWISSVFIFWLLAIGIFRSQKVNYLFVFFAISLGILSFLATGLKTRLFISFFIFTLLIFIKNPKLGALKFIQLFCGGLISIGLIIPHTIILAGIDRILTLPGLLNLRYIEFFGNNPLYLFQDSSLHFLFPFSDKNYLVSPGYTIDCAYGCGGMNANTGAFGSIYGDIGILGILIFFPLFIAILDILFKSLTQNDKLLTGLGVYYSFILVNSPPIDLILTHGILIHLIFFYIGIEKLIKS